MSDEPEEIEIEDLIAGVRRNGRKVKRLNDRLSAMEEEWATYRTKLNNQTVNFQRLSCEVSDARKERSLTTPDAAKLRKEIDSLISQVQHLTVEVQILTGARGPEPDKPKVVPETVSEEVSMWDNAASAIYSVWTDTDLKFEDIAPDSQYLFRQMAKAAIDAHFNNPFKKLECPITLKPVDSDHYLGAVDKAAKAAWLTEDCMTKWEDLSKEDKDRYRGYVESVIKVYRMDTERPLCELIRRMGA